jgi:hypothetical protein
VQATAARRVRQGEAAQSAMGGELPNWDLGIGGINVDESRCFYFLFLRQRTRLETNDGSQGNKRLGFFWLYNGGFVPCAYLFGFIGAFGYPRQMTEHS